jgi:hypothetical protein
MPLFVAQVTDRPRQTDGLMNMEQWWNGADRGQWWSNGADRGHWWNNGADRGHWWNNGADRGQPKYWLKHLSL